jgi:cytochrome b561
MLRNTNDSWGWPARAFHWIVAALVLGLFAHGLLLEALPRDARPDQVWLHVTVGASLIGIVTAGFVWWLLNPVPREPAGTPHWQATVARLVHWALYALVFFTVGAGWLLNDAMRNPVDMQMFGFIPLPRLLAPGTVSHGALEEAHEIAAYLLIALVGLHVAAALWHHFVLRDAVLQRMLAGKPKRGTAAVGSDKQLIEARRGAPVGAP